jgi:RNA 2',3'-cyclic 3'-phosphodiesterase
VRLFVALEIPSEIRENLAALIRELRTIASREKWVRAENLHVTLKFIGEMAPEKVSPIREALALVHSNSAVRLDFRGLGFFPDEKHPRVFWAGMEASPNLQKLAADIETATEKLGIAREQRPFSPHLTLARFETRKLPPNLQAAVRENLKREFGAFETAQFHLIESKLKPSGAEYTTLQSFPFVAEA